MFTYIQSEPQLWTVGLYDPSGVWHPESDHANAEAAADRVHWLNGGQSRHTTPDARLIAAAPDLLAACQAVLAGFRYEKERPVMAEWKMKEILAAAIDKATTET